MLDGCLDALAGHELVAGEPGSDPGADGLICGPMQPVDGAAIDRMGRLRVIAVAARASAPGVTVVVGHAMTADRALGSSSDSEPTKEIKR